MPYNLDTIENIEMSESDNVEEVRKECPSPSELLQPNPEKGVSADSFPMAGIDAINTVGYPIGNMNDENINEEVSENFEQDPVIRYVEISNIPCPEESYENGESGSTKIREIVQAAEKGDIGKANSTMSGGEEDAQNEMVVDETTDTTTKEPVLNKEIEVEEPAVANESFKRLVDEPVANEPVDGMIEETVGNESTIITEEPVVDKVAPVENESSGIAVEERVVNESSESAMNTDEIVAVKSGKISGNKFLCIKSPSHLLQSPLEDMEKVIENVPDVPKPKLAHQNSIGVDRASGNRSNKRKMVENEGNETRTNSAEMTLTKHSNILKNLLGGSPRKVKGLPYAISDRVELGANANSTNSSSTNHSSASSLSDFGGASNDQPGGSYGRADQASLPVAAASNAKRMRMETSNLAASNIQVPIPSILSRYSESRSSSSFQRTNQDSNKVKMQTLELEKRKQALFQHVSTKPKNVFLLPPSFEKKAFACRACSQEFSAARFYHNHIRRRLLKIQQECRSCGGLVSFANPCTFMMHKELHGDLHWREVKVSYDDGMGEDDVENDLRMEEVVSMLECVQKKRREKAANAAALLLTASRDEEEEEGVSDIEMIEVDDDEELEAPEEVPEPPKAKAVKNELRKKEIVKLRNFCVLCNTKVPHLVNHYRGSNRPLKKLQCQTCQYMPSSTCSGKAHTRLHLKNETDPYTCLDCGMVFKIKNDLQKHFEKSLHGNREVEYTCGLCGNQTVDGGFNAFVKHMINHTKVFRCLKCAETFKSQQTMLNHLHTCHAQAKYGPWKCGLFQEEGQSLSYTCPFCPVSKGNSTPPDFKSWFSYSDHVKQHAYDQKMKYVHVCKMCGYTSQLLNYFESHVKSYCSNKPGVKGKGGVKGKLAVEREEIEYENEEDVMEEDEGMTEERRICIKCKASTIEGDQPFCAECGKEVNGEKGQGMAARSKRDYKCKYCHLNMGRDYSILKQHIKRVHANNIDDMDYTPVSLRTNMTYNNSKARRTKRRAAPSKKSACNTAKMVPDKAKPIVQAQVRNSLPLSDTQYNKMAHMSEVGLMPSRKSAPPTGPTMSAKEIMDKAKQQARALLLLQKGQKCASVEKHESKQAAKVSIQRSERVGGDVKMSQAKSEVQNPGDSVGKMTKPGTSVEKTTKPQANLEKMKSPASAGKTTKLQGNLEKVKSPVSAEKATKPQINLDKVKSPANAEKTTKPHANLEKMKSPANTEKTTKPHANLEKVKSPVSAEKATKPQINLDKVKSPANAEKTTKPHANLEKVKSPASAEKATKPQINLDKVKSPARVENTKSPACVEKVKPQIQLNSQRMEPGSEKIPGTKPQSMMQEPEVFQCSVCEFTCNNQRILEMHNRKHGMLMVTQHSKQKKTALEARSI